MDKPLRTGRIALNISDSLKERLQKAEVTTGVLAIHMLAKASESICDYVEKHKAITMPFSVIPTPEFETLKSRLKELETENSQLKGQRPTADTQITRSVRSASVTSTADIGGATETGRRRSGIKVSK
jgi:GTP-sensing pleiotropic transcriptional regulator CodY